MKKETPEYCKECHKKIVRDKFRTLAALKEYEKTGLCQECQDKEKLIELRAKGFFHKGERGY